MPKEQITTKSNLRLLEHKLFCDCGVELERSNEVLLSAPPIYIYKCPNCKKEIHSRTSYPYSNLEGDETQTVLVQRDSI